MYRYPVSSSSLKLRKRLSILLVLALVLAIACAGLGIAYGRAAKANANTSSILLAKAQNEVSNAKTRAYQLTQASSSTVAATVALVRQHIYALRQLNDLMTGIYGGGASFIDMSLLESCETLLNDCDLKLQSGASLSVTFVELRDAVDSLYNSISVALA